MSYVKLVSEQGNGFFAWNGKVYESDIVRACIRPKVKAIGKLVGKHIRETVTPEGKSLKVNPEPYIKFLLEEPNAIMSGQMLQEKLATQLCLNNNAFALIIRDEFGYAESIFPINASGCEAVYSQRGELYLKFYFQNGKVYTFSYNNIIHLRNDFFDNDVFGTNKFAAIEPLMQVLNTIDQGIIKAIKNGSVIRWLLKFTKPMRPEDIKKNTEEFVASFLDISNSSGAAGIDPNTEAIQVRPNDYVPSASLMASSKIRLQEFFNTNTKIINSSRDEDEWNAYFDAEVEPELLQLQNEYTRKLFTRKERGFGNKIVFEAAAWDSASLETKLNLVALVDRGALTPNEWRATFNLAPLPGGDDPVRRLDTATVNAVEGGDE